MPISSVRQLATSLLLVCAVLLTAGCGDEQPAPATDDQSSGVSIEVTVEDGEVDPKGERVDVTVGEEIEFLVQADTAGELHVHSVPEQTLAYGSGTTTLKLTIDQPGVIEVESHDPEQVVVQLEAR